MNFIDDEGHKTYIKNKYDQIFEKLPPNIKLYDEDYKSISDLRHYLLDNNISFKYYIKGRPAKLKIFKKNVITTKNEELENICGSLSDIDKKLLFNSFNENIQFFKGPKADKVKNFFAKIEYDKKSNQDKNKILKEYVDNYFDIIN